MLSRSAATATATFARTGAATVTATGAFRNNSGAARALLRRRNVGTVNVGITTATTTSSTANTAAESAALGVSVRPFSSAAGVRLSSSAAASASALPTRHSRHLPRPVCTDLAELEATTSSLLAGRPGSLFAYEYSGHSGHSGHSGNKGGNKAKAAEYEAGLARSDVATQKFQWALGGHAAAIPGTVASAAAAAAAGISGSDSGTSSTSSSNPQQHLDAMVGLLERIEEEGRVYVELRARILNRQHQQQQYGGIDNTAALTAATDGSSSSDSSDSSGSESDSDSSDSDSESESESAQSASTSSSASAWRIQTLINRYGAPPGPSIHMYDALLDAIACYAEKSDACNASASSDNSDNNNGKSSLEYLALARSVYERAMARHHADGGPNANNRLTVPTLVTHNAVLRTCAAVEYPYPGTDGTSTADDQEQEQEQEKIRDAALDLAFRAYDALNSPSTTTSNRASKNKGFKTGRKARARATATAMVADGSGSIYPQRNSATYVHILRTIAKYLPPSPTRGNVAYGLWRSCTGHDGVLDGNVLRAYVEANTRNGSNGQDYDGFVQKLTTATSATSATTSTSATGSGDTGNIIIQENDMLRQNWWRNRKSRRMTMGMDMGQDVENY